MGKSKFSYKKVIVIKLNRFEVVSGKYIEEIIQALETGQSIEKDNYVEEKVFTQKNVLSVLNDRTY